MKANTTARPLVSVAIPTFNHCSFVRECLESVLQQDYPNFEVVVADDGSSDETPDVLRTFARHYPDRLRLLLSPRNRGITENSNEAHRACRGKYIAWMGGDDLMLPGKLTAQVEWMEAHPTCNICYHDLEVFESETGRVLGRYSDAHRVRSGSVREVIRWGTFNGACASMVRASCTPRHGFDRAIPVASDWLYWIETLAHGGSIDFIDCVLGRYRKHSGSVTRRSPGRINQASVDHMTSCVLLASRYPSYRREISARYADLLWLNRKAMPGMGLGIASIACRFRADRLAKLALADPVRWLLRR